MRRIRLFSVVSGFVSLIFIAVYLAYTFIPPLWTKAESTAFTAQHKMGWTVEQLNIQGRSHITAGELKKAIDVQRGELILPIDLENLYERLMALPWIHHVIIQRKLPSILSIKIVERTPRALFQHQGSFTLVDEEGVVIEQVDPKTYATFIVLTGKDAPKNSPVLLRELKEFPIIEQRSTGAVFISERRWDLILDHNIRIKLPQENIKNAFNQLEKLIQDGKLSADDIKSLDLRQKDRIYFFLSDKALEKKKAKSKAGPLKVA